MRGAAYFLICILWVNTSLAEQLLICQADLPLLDKSLREITNMKHVWLDLNGKTYGMTSTLERTFWGGPAIIETPDRVSKKWWRHMTRKKCQSLYRNKN